MSIEVHNEVEARASIKTVIDASTIKYELELLERKPSKAGKYMANFAIIVKDGSFSTAFIKSVFDFVVQSDGLFEFNGSQRDIKDMNWDVMLIETEITP